MGLIMKSYIQGLITGSVLVFSFLVLTGSYDSDDIMGELDNMKSDVQSIKSMVMDIESDVGDIESKVNNISFYGVNCL